MMTENWLPTLKTPDPQSGFELAVMLSRRAVKMTQPDAAKREDLRKIYETDAQALIDASAVVAAHFQTVAMANAYWSDHK